MIEPSTDADLPQESLGAERGGDLGVHHLERHVAVVAEIVREIDRGHAAAAELALDRVAAGQLRPEAVRDVRHREPAISASHRSLCWSPRLR